VQGIQHTSYVHIVDARTFAYQECVEMPQPPPQTAPAPSSSPRQSVVSEVENTSANAGSARTSLVSQRQVERDLYALNSHGLRNRLPPPGHLVARRSSYYRPPIFTPRDEVDVTIIDEEPSPSRSSPDIAPDTVDDDFPLSVMPHESATHDDYEDENDYEYDGAEYADHPHSHYPSGPHDDHDDVVASNDDQHSPVSPRPESSDWLHLAGACYDPSGTHIYAAGLASIASWKIHGSDRRWWGASEWL
jgi:hypothetical protein